MNMTLFNLNIIFLITDVILYIILLYFIAKQKKRKFNLATTREFLIFLDQYYISNKYYTFFMCFIYFSFTIIPVFILRYVYLGFDLIITPLTFNFGILITLLLLFMLIIIIQTFINLIFKKEIQKLYLYIISTSAYLKIHLYIIRNNWKLHCFWGKCVLFTETIARLDLNSRSNLFDISTPTYLYENIYENSCVMSLSELGIYFARKFVIVQYIFKFLSKILLFYCIFRCFGSECNTA